MQTEIIKKAEEIIAQNLGEKGFCTLSLIDGSGYPAVSTISASKADGIRQLTFCTGLCSPKVERIRGNSKAGVCFNSINYNISLIGTIEIITDQKVKDEMWYGGLSDQFSGSDDPRYCVLRFTTQSYNLLIDWQELRGNFNIN